MSSHNNDLNIDLEEDLDDYLNSISVERSNPSPRQNTTLKDPLKALKRLPAKIKLSL